jgi:site-specific recombinase XerD
VAGLHFHDLRHGAVTRLFERGLSTEEVMGVSGHRTYATLARYTHLRAEGLAAKLG